MAVDIHVEEDFAMPNGVINPAFKAEWEKYSFLAGPPKDRGDILVFDGITKIKFLSVDTVIALSDAAPRNEVYGYPVWAEMSDYKYNNSTVPEWVQGSEKVDEEGVGTGVYKKWSEWKDELCYTYGGKWYVPKHAFNKAIGLKGTEISLLKTAGYTILTNDEFAAIRDQHTPDPV